MWTCIILGGARAHPRTPAHAGGAVGGEARNETILPNGKSKETREQQQAKYSFTPITLFTLHHRVTGTHRLRDSVRGPQAALRFQAFSHSWRAAHRLHGQADVLVQLRHAPLGVLDAVAVRLLDGDTHLGGEAGRRATGRVAW